MVVVVVGGMVVIITNIKGKTRMLEVVSDGEEALDCRGSCQFRGEELGCLWTVVRDRSWVSVLNSERLVWWRRKEK